MRSILRQTDSILLVHRKSADGTLQSNISSLVPWLRASCRGRPAVYAEKAKTDADRAEFEAYRARQSGYRASQEALLDSLRGDEQRLRRDADSSSRRVYGIKARQKEHAARREAFRQHLVSLCDDLDRTLRALPPANVRPQLQALSFLNDEGVERLWQIVFTTVDNAEQIEVYSGASPVDQIAGHGYFVRIGYAYLAFINDEGTAGALWTAVADSSGTWETLSDPSVLSALHDSIRIREGKSVPRIIAIPFRHAIADDGREEGGAQ
jgi:hypothetical protein